MMNILRYKASLECLTRRRVIPISSFSEVVEHPLFIVGSGRSGNTLLRRGLVEHSTLVIPPETYVLGGIIRFFYRHNSIGWDAFVKYALASFCFHPEFDDTFNLRLSKLHTKLVNLPAERRSLQYLLRSFYVYYANEQGVAGVNLTNSRWGDKTPLNTYSVWHLSKIFPAAYFIGMYRDPVDVVASYLKSKIYTTAESASLRWLNSNKILMNYKRVNPDLCMIVRYEELVRNYDAKIQEVCRFCELGYRAEPVQQALGDVGARPHHSNVLGLVTPASVGKGSMELNTTQLRTVERITGKFHSNYLRERLDA